MFSSNCCSRIRIRSRITSVFVSMAGRQSLMKATSTSTRFWEA